MVASHYAPSGASSDGCMNATELTYLVPALNTADGAKGEDGVGRFQEIAVVSRETERMRLFDGESTARTYRFVRV
jgi:hypothetical protein